MWSCCSVHWQSVVPLCVHTHTSKHRPQLIFTCSTLLFLWYKQCTGLKNKVYSLLYLWKISNTLITDLDRLMPGKTQNWKLRPKIKYPQMFTALSIFAVNHMKFFDGSSDILTRSPCPTLTHPDRDRFFWFSWQYYTEINGLQGFVCCTQLHYTRGLNESPLRTKEGHMSL